MPVVKLTGLSRPRAQGNLSELKTRQVRLIDRASAGYKEILLYQDGAGRLIITTTGGGTTPTILEVFLTTLELLSANPSIVALSYPAILDLLGVGEVVRVGYLAVRQTAVTVSANDQTLTVGGTGTSGFIRLTTAAARTGLRMEAGDYDGQTVTLFSVVDNADTITFHTTESTSLVAGSATFGIISPGMAVRLMWNVYSGRWYPVRPLT